MPQASMSRLHETMVRIRLFEEAIAEILETRPGEIITPCHLYTGQEAVAAGVCLALEKEDAVYSTHRSHGHFIAKGGDLKALAAEIYCRETGCSKGRGGSMHLHQPEIGHQGSCPIVAGTIPLAVGTAYAYKQLKNRRIVAPFFGDGAVCEGVLYESLNLAALYQLPILFVCENNGYSTHMPIDKILADTDICAKAEAMGVPSQKAYGNNVEMIYETTKTLTENIRNGTGPQLIECITYRFRGHVGPKYDIDKGLRSKEELDQWMNRDPLNMIPPKELAEMKKRIGREVEEAIQYARQSQPPKGATEGIYA